MASNEAGELGSGCCDGELEDGGGGGEIDEDDEDAGWFRGGKERSEAMVEVVAVMDDEEVDDDDVKLIGAAPGGGGGGGGGGCGLVGIDADEAGGGGAVKLASGTIVAGWNMPIVLEKKSHLIKGILLILNNLLPSVFCCNEPLFRMECFVMDLQACI